MKRCCLQHVRENLKEIYKTGLDNRSFATQTILVVVGSTMVRPPVPIAAQLYSCSGLAINKGAPGQP
jgi:hypothetical protein